jgi:hypothetical protein
MIGIGFTEVEFSRLISPLNCKNWEPTGKSRVPASEAIRKQKDDAYDRFDHLT